MDNSLQPPAANEIELSLFGPGIGECVVVHLGQGEWMVVDSCLNEAQDRPIALDYLESIGVDVAKQVALVVVTHWHDDHIRGSAKVLEAADNARFVCSAALRNPEFFTLIEASKENKTVVGSSSASEFASILEELHRRKQRGRRAAAGPDHWAADGLTLFPLVRAGKANVTVLSPSAQTITDATVRLAQLLPSANALVTSYPRCSPNDQSVALLVHSEQCSLLLGADLETVSDPSRGWRYVVNSALRPQTNSIAFKVAHHGSHNGDLDEVWTSMLAHNPVAVLTPFSSGRQPLPSDADIARIRSRTELVFCTAPRAVRPRRHRSVDRTMREIVRSHYSATRKVGHIRVRSHLAEPVEPTIELRSGAFRLE